MPPPPTRRRPVALEGRAQSRCVSIVKERETHVSLRTHGSHRGFGTRARTWITRFRVSCPADWTIPKKNYSRSGGSRTRAARSKSPACCLNTSNREVGPEGVKPSPRRVKAGHASLHLDPVLLSLLLALAFAFHRYTSISN